MSFNFNPIPILMALVATVISIRTGFLDPLVDWFKDFVLNQIITVVWSLAPDALAEYVSTADLDFFADLIADLTWFLPFWQVLFIYVNAIGIACSVLLVRYVIGWVPTVEG